MDSTTFDTVARTLSTTVTRRSALRGLVAGALAATAGGAALETSAKRHRKARTHRQLQPGDFCKTDNQCNHHDPHYICGRRVFNDEQRVCCGTLDAVCDSSADCCYGYLCLNGLCVVI